MPPKSTIPLAVTRRVWNTWGKEGCAGCGTPLVEGSCKFILIHSNTAATVQNLRPVCHTCADSIGDDGLYTFAKQNGIDITGMTDTAEGEAKVVPKAAPKGETKVAVPGNVMLYFVQQCTDSKKYFMDHCFVACKMSGYDLDEVMGFTDKDRAKMARSVWSEFDSDEKGAVRVDYTAAKEGATTAAAPTAAPTTPKRVALDKISTEGLRQLYEICRPPHTREMYLSLLEARARAGTLGPDQSMTKSELEELCNSYDVTVSGKLKADYVSALARHVRTILDG